MQKYEIYFNKLSITVNTGQDGWSAAAKLLLLRPF